MDITTKPPATLRLLLACCCADPAGPLTVCQKALLWQRLHDGAWFPTPETLPTGITFALLQAWLDGLTDVRQVYAARLGQEEVTLC